MRVYTRDDLTNDDGVRVRRCHAIFSPPEIWHVRQMRGLHFH